MAIMRSTYLVYLIREEIANCGTDTCNVTTDKEGQGSRVVQVADKCAGLHLVSCYSVEIKQRFDSLRPKEAVPIQLMDVNV